jgi:sugar lactone lactonase YvrE
MIRDRTHLFIISSGLVVFLLMSVWTAPVWAAFSFQNGQNAALVLGQTSFASTNFALSRDKLHYPTDVAVDPISKKVFVVDWSNNRVLRFSKLTDLQNGVSPEVVLGQPNFTSSSAATTRSGFRTVVSITVDANGRLWVADYNNHRVLRFDNAASKADGANADGVLGQVDYVSRIEATTRNGMRNPSGLAVDANGTLWVAEYNNSRILRFDNAASKANGANADGVLGQTTYTTLNVATTQSGLRTPMGIATDSSGNLWVADYGNNRVLRFNNAASKANGATADGVLGQTNFIVSTSATSQKGLSNPIGVSVDSQGRLWVADFNNHRVLAYDNAASKAYGANADLVLGQADFTSGAIGSGQSGLYNPYNVATDPSGAVWVPDMRNNRVLMFNNQTIDFSAPADSVVGGSTTLDATASSGLPVSFESLTPLVCGISGGTVVMLTTGTCTIQASQAGDGTTHTAATSVQQSFEVKQAAPITWDAPAAISYGTALSASQLNASSSVAGTFSYNPPLGSVLPTGNHTLTATFAPSDPLYGPSQKSVVLTVNKAPLTITAQHASRLEGEANPAFTVSYSGFVNGEDQSILSGTLLISSAANASSSAGNYPIVPSGLTSNNYTISYVNGTLTVQPKPVTQWNTFLPFVSR